MLDANRDTGGPLRTPRPGDLVRVRARHWLVEDRVAPRAPSEQTLVRLIGVDDDNSERRLAVLWERELDAQISAEAAFERLGERGFDPRARFAGYLRTLRWNAVTATDPRLLQAPFRAGIRLEPYQLEPLAKALRLPRVNLLIADDVGLGKTIEAGLVVRELMLRRRVDLVVVAGPPSMLHQWQSELRTRFGLDAVLLDRAFLRDLRRERGFAVDPWSVHSRFPISHQLLIDDSWSAGLRNLLGSFRPKSLLILDEAHHAAPSSGQRFAVDSQFTRAVRDLAGRFEHRLFLTATPHNGHSNSFAALLELLDPQRFVRGLKVRKRDLEPIAVRRLKDDLRALGEPGRGFPERRVEAITIDDLPDDDPALVLGRLLDRYRQLVEARLRSASETRRRAALLVLSTLQHRLLSSIAAFATTLERHAKAVERAAERAARASTAAVAALARRVEPPSAADAAESEPTAEGERGEETDAAQLEAVELLTDIGRRDLRPSPEELRLLAGMREIAKRERGKPDRRIGWLLDWIDREFCPGFRGDPERTRWTEKRLVVFTEWEGTRRWLEQHLRAAIEATPGAEERIACYTGLTSMDTRRRIQAAFNEPAERNPLRILLCTDAAREGLNLQRHCSELLHFDLPWNPARIEQRNGRIDRKLQPAPVVRCRDFVFPQRPEDRVLQALLRKTETIRRELGPMGSVLDERLHARLEAGIAHERAAALADEIARLDIFGRTVITEELGGGRDPAGRQELAKRLDQLTRQLERSRAQLRFDPDRLRQVVDASLRLLFHSRGLLPAGEEKASDGSPIPLWRIDPEDPALRGEPRLARLVDELRWPVEQRRERGDGLRPVTFVETDRLGEEVVQLHLEHPLVRRLLARFGAQGVVEHCLSRACLAASTVREPRALLLGRLILLGPGAARLHEEILAVAARWVPPERRRGPLEALGRETTEQLLDQLEAALDEADAPELPETLRGRRERRAGARPVRSRHRHRRRHGRRGRGGRCRAGAQRSTRRRGHSGVGAGDLREDGSEPPLRGRLQRGRDPARRRGRPALGHPARSGPRRFGHVDFHRRRRPQCAVARPIGRAAARRAAGRAREE